MIVFIARRLFVCSRLVVVQIQTYHQTNARVFLGELDFFLSPRKKRQNKNRFFTRSWFYFKLFRRQKRRSFGEKKQQQKSIIALSFILQRETPLRSHLYWLFHQTLALHRTSSFLQTPLDRSQRNDERGRSLSLPRRLPPWRFGKIPEWKKGKAVRESTEKASQKKDPNLRGLPLRASVRRRSRQSFHRARVCIRRVRARSARRRRGDRVFSYIIYTKTCVLFVFNRAIVCFPRGREWERPKEKEEEILPTWIIILMYIIIIWLLPLSPGMVVEGATTTAA